MTNEQVIKAWTNGQSAKSGNMSTNGIELYSYSLMIGTNSGGVIYNHTAPGGSYYSQTTSKHVGLARRYSPHAEIVSF